jgi:hypothetical protein
MILLRKAPKYKVFHTKNINNIILVFDKINNYYA